MRLKQYERYQIDFCGKWVTAAGGFMGLSVFLRIVQYFGVHMITDFGVGDIVLRLAIPTLFSALFVCIGNLIANLLYGVVDPQIREVGE